MKNPNPVEVYARKKSFKIKIKEKKYGMKQKFKMNLIKRKSWAEGRKQTKGERERNFAGGNFVTKNK